MSPFPPPAGGMAVQAERLVRCLRRDGLEVHPVAANLEPPPPVRRLARGPLRPAVRLPFFLGRLARSIGRSEVVYVLAASGVYFFTVVLPALLVSRALGRRAFVSYRGGAPQRFFRRFRPLVRAALGMAEAVTVPSGYLQGVLREELGLEAVVVPNLVELERFAYRRRFPLRPRLLVTRQLEELYDIPTALRALGRLRERRPEASLSLAGGGSQAARLREMARRMGLPVAFLGEVPQPDLPAVYDRHDILLNPSRADNFPGSVLEAFACGLPVVSTRVGGTPWLVEHGRTGLLVEPGDDRAMAEAVGWLLAHPGEAAAMAERARRVAERHGWEHVRRRLLSLWGLG